MRADWGRPAVMPRDLYRHVPHDLNMQTIAVFRLRHRLGE
jgi:hypothetical protein